MRAFRTLFAAVLATVTVASTSPAQCPGQWLPGDGVPGVSGGVADALELSDGSILVGGAFDFAGTAPVAHIARYFPATNSWQPVGSGVTLPPLFFTEVGVFAFMPLPDGDVLIGGCFTTINGMPAGAIARWNPTINTFSTIGNATHESASIMPYVGGFVPLPSGEVIVHGRFTAIGGVASPSIAKWNPASGVWSSLGGGTGPGLSDAALLPDGRIVVVGALSSAGGVPVHQIAIFDPVTDTWAPLGTGGNSIITECVCVTPNGDIYAGGDFFQFNGQNIRYLARRDHVTGVWSALGSGFPNITTFQPINALVALPDGDVLIGGVFTQANGQNVRRIGRWSQATSSWTPLDPITPSTLDSGSRVSMIKRTSGGDILAGGGFSIMGGIPASGIARRSAATGTWSSLGLGTHYSIDTLAHLPGGDILAGGTFLTIRGLTFNGIARWNPSTDTWSSNFGTGVSGRLSGATTPAVFASAVLPNGSGDFYVGGSFTEISGVSASGIARWNAATSTWTPLGVGVNATVRALAFRPNGELIVGGAFTTAGGSNAASIARWTPSTGTWSAINLGGTVRALAIMPDGDLIAGGTFTITGAANLARRDFSTGGWSDVAGGVNGIVNALTVLPDGGLLVAGQFTTAGGNPATNIALYRESTNSWSALGSGIIGSGANVYSLTPRPDGKIVIGGSFATAGGVSAPSVALLTPSPLEWSPFGSGVSTGPVYAAANLPNSDLIVGGGITKAGGKLSKSFARWTTRRICPADQDCSGVANVGDIFVFLADWFAADPDADFDSVGGVTVADIFAFLAAWFAGCS